MEKGYYIGSIDNGDIIIKRAIGEYDILKNPKNRYSLTIELNKNNDSTLTVIMFNPSEKEIFDRSSLEDSPIDLTPNGKKTFIDGTITNVIKIATKCNYSRIIVWNLFSEINSSPKEINKDPKKYIDSNNEIALDNILKENNDVLIAWGGILRKKIEEITEIKRKICIQARGRLKCFSMNKKTPTHPCSRPYNQNKVNEFIDTKDKLDPLDETYCYN